MLRAGTAPIRFKGQAMSLQIHKHNPKEIEPPGNILSVQDDEFSSPDPSGSITNRIFKQITTNIYIPGSRTSETNELCAAVSARRLCEY
jgi:hypothetical protein